ncbi:MAG TPA: DEAD/DEAH box helicase [Rhodanobacteraceae bacterium]|nr:DEAD/DEAH box helicase [Rhodanobacteraceae bacterium]
MHTFHPAVSAWFESAFDAPTEAQSRAWPAIQSHRDVLIAAPTGSGKTLAAFLAAIDDLVWRGVAGTLNDETHVVYVSPLKALSNDVRINLEVPIEGIRAQLERMGLSDVEIRTAVRTGDTPQVERTAMRRRPPHIVVTTPESLYILLGSESGRAMLATTRAVIVDEIHALTPNKRGSHLALSLARLDALCGQRPLRIGLSATQKPIEMVADFLVGAPTSLLPSGEGAACTIIDTGHQRARDLGIEVTNVPLQPVMSNDAWGLVYDRIAELIDQHRTTLIFANTRRTVERATRHLSERLGKEAVAAHHGSLSKEKRLDAERRLKSGQLRALVATASLELGIDIGEVELVCQLGSPRSIAAFLQRAGRAGHAVNGISKARLFPTSRDDLAECAALLDCERRGELDTLHVPRAPLDVLAQQIVAEVACGERDETELFELVRSAYPYRELSREKFNEVLRMLAEGYSTRRGTRGAYLHRDAVNGKLRARRNARLTAITSGGAIPDTADYDVVLEPAAQRVGSVNEDFAVESIAGDIFQLGNQSYRILKVERGRVRVEDAHGAPPSIPFWLGEAPGRSDELSWAVSRLREEISERLDDDGHITSWLRDEVGVVEPAAKQLVEYYQAARTELGVLPTHTTLAMERFFDESGGTQLVIHSPYGSRLNRAWGLALRKRFCRTFNFELQAAATEDAIVLSLSTSHSFPLEEVSRYLHSNTVRDVLTQALLDAPMFTTRWRWNASAALALPRFVGGAKVPPQIQRMKSEDLLATVFPDQVACAENLVGERQIPDHPLVEQTLQDCLYEAMDLEGLTALLKKLEGKEVRIIARDLTAPSSLCAEVLGAKPYAYLDDAPLEERRTQAVASRGFTDASRAEDLGKLDADAIEGVREEAWPQPRDADEMHEALLALGAINSDEAQRTPGWDLRLRELAQSGRAAQVLFPSPSGRGCPATCAGQFEAPTAPSGGAGEGSASRQASIHGAQSSRRPASSSVAARDAIQGIAQTQQLRPHPSPLPEGEGLKRLWVATETLPMWRAVHADAQLSPAVEAPPEFASKVWTLEQALVEIVRARLGCLGPVQASALAETFAVPQADVELALGALEREGFVMRGRFTPNASHEEWCERHLLARIHRRTLNRLRREIEPVEAHEFMRFLFRWQHVSHDARWRGAEALGSVLAQLEGFEAPAGAWESQLLPARLRDYDIGWLDGLCSAGRIAWTRLRAASGAHAAPVRASPIVLLPRRQLALWSSLGANASAEAPALSSRAQVVAEYLAQHGASFFDEMLGGTRLLRVELEEALAELVGAGLVSADSFSGLRAMLLPSSKRNAPRHRRLRRNMLSGIEDAGRWSLIRREGLFVPAEEPPRPAGESRGVSAMPNPHPNPSPEGRGAESDALEHIARTLLRRWGVVFWTLLQREAAWLPPWRELRRVYQRLEARGEIRGGRFVAGMVGEQFALPEAIGALRSARKEHDESLIVISGADPLNLIGSVLPGEKVPVLTNSRIVFRDGLPLAKQVAGEVVLLQSLSSEEARGVRGVLRQGGSSRRVSAEA